MNRQLLLIVALESATALPFPAEAAHVDYDHACSFSHYKTYDWSREGDSHSAGALFPNQLMQERIVRFVEEALAAKGLSRKGTAPDIHVTYKITVTENPEFTTYSDSFGPAWGWGYWGCCGTPWGWGGGWGSTLSTTTMQTIRLGTLVIDMTDPRQNQLVFEGLNTAEISSKPEKNSTRLQKGVNEIFERYPPRN